MYMCVRLDYISGSKCLHNLIKSLKLYRLSTLEYFSDPYLFFFIENIDMREPRFAPSQIVFDYLKHNLNVRFLVLIYKTCKNDKNQILIHYFLNEYKDLH